jgi:DNA mismatch endonuclease, patch repair protein
MTDILTPEQRSLLMARVQGRDTKPEWILRSALHRLGFRFTLNNRNLVGKPDLVLPKYRAVIFIHGCFWHQHKRCKKASIPEKNRKFWYDKLSGNAKRDKKNELILAKQGFNVIVVWECQLYNQTIETLERVVQALLNSRKLHSTHREKIDYMNSKSLLKLAEQKVNYRLNRNRMP